MLQKLSLFLVSFYLFLYPYPTLAHFGVNDEANPAELGVTGLHPTVLVAILLALIAISSIVVQFLRRYKKH